LIYHCLCVAVPIMIAHVSRLQRVWLIAPAAPKHDCRLSRGMHCMTVAVQENYSRMPTLYVIDEHLTFEEYAGLYKVRERLGAAITNCLSSCRAQWFDCQRHSGTSKQRLGLCLLVLC
jgi:hypothetical protein